MPRFLLPLAPVTSLDDYLRTEVGGRGIAKARELGPSATVDELERSGLRGRGGGGFPTAAKWRGIAAQTGERRYLVCNGAEGEPGTFKDRSLLRANPYQLVEGVIVAAFAIGAHESYICLKASFEAELAAVTRAVAEFQAANLCGDCVVTIVAGPDEYLFGEEKAMLEVIEGNDPLPRMLPPYLHGLFASSPQIGWQSHEAGRPDSPAPAGSNPTLVNNVETLSNVPHILTNGWEWFRSMGTEASPGTVVATVTGDVARDAVGEIEMGTSLRSVIDSIGGGTEQGRSVKAVFSGVANPVITGAAIDSPVSYEGLDAAGSGMGSAGFIVYDDTTCMVETAYRLSRFLSVESCGQCSPCKLGSSAITQHLENIEGGSGTKDDLDGIVHWLRLVTDGSRCYLATEEQRLVASIIQAFPEEFDEHIEGGHCPRPRKLPIPKLLDIVDGQAIYDERFWRKRPDWTYDPE